jgi:hypothetical protein
MKKSKPQKFTKEQLDAIHSIKVNIDELSNKPRRLFYALEQFAYAFWQDTKEEQKQLGFIVSKIREAQEYYYHDINTEMLLEECGNQARKTRLELNEKIICEEFNYIKDKKERGQYEEGYKQGVNEATKMMAKGLVNEFIDELY